MADFLKNLCVSKKKENKKIDHFTSVLFSKHMLRIVNGFAPWILINCFPSVSEPHKHCC